MASTCQQTRSIWLKRRPRFYKPQQRFQATHWIFIAMDTRERQLKHDYDATVLMKMERDDH